MARHAQDETREPLEMFSVPSIDIGDLSNAIASYRETHSRDVLDSDYAGHARAADLVVPFVQREYSQCPRPLTQLHWPELFWQRLMMGCGLLDVAPAFAVHEVTKYEGLVIFNGDAIGNYTVFNGVQALRYEILHRQ